VFEFALIFKTTVRPTCAFCDFYALCKLYFYMCIVLVLHTA